MKTEQESKNAMMGKDYMESLMNERTRFASDIIESNPERPMPNEPVSPPVRVKIDEAPTNRTPLPPKVIEQMLNEAKERINQIFGQDMFSIPIKTDNSMPKITDAVITIPIVPEPLVNFEIRPNYYYGGLIAVTLIIDDGHVVTGIAVASPDDEKPNIHMGIQIALDRALIAFYTIYRNADFGSKSTRISYDDNGNAQLGPKNISPFMEQRVALCLASLNNMSKLG